MGQEYNITDAKKREFFAQMHQLLHAGLSFSAAFSLIVESSSGPDKELFQTILDKIVSGESLWEALSANKSFNRLDCGVIRIGEESGNLMEGLSFLTDYYDKKETHRRNIISALSYPLITLGVAVIVLAFMMLVVVPMFEQVYSRMGGELPSLTRAIINISAQMPKFLIVLAVVSLCLFLLSRLYGKNGSYQNIKAQFLFSIPVVGPLLKKTELSRFSTIMNLLVSSDVPILQSLIYVADILQYYPYRQAVIHVGKEVERGMTLYSALSSYPELFNRKFLVLLRVGEETASLDKMLKSLSEDITAELNYAIKQINNTLEPFMILVIGIIVAFVLLSMYLPMFKLGMTIQ